MPSVINYDEFWKTARLSNRRKHPLRRVVDAYRLPRHRLLEIGPGTRPTLPIDGSFFLDNAPSAIERLRLQGGIGAVGDANKTLPYEDAFFDLVCAFDVLEHLENDEKACREVSRILKPGGIFIISVPMNQRHWTAFDQFVGHWRRYEPQPLKRLVQGSGFEMEQVFISSSPLYSAFISFPLTKWLASLVIKASPLFLRQLGFLEECFSTQVMQCYVRPLRKALSGLDSLPSSIHGACLVCRKPSY